MKRIPEGWLPYSAVGQVIPGTRFIAFKVPLCEKMNNCLPPNERFSTAHLMERCPKLSLVVDLTNSQNPTRYYNRNDFLSNSIAHEKIQCPGQVIPPDHLARRFNILVDNFLKNNEQTDGLIGVHCTHGVNRTGYLICRYMVERMGMTPEEAVAVFTEARGHGIRRENYVQDLQRVKHGVNYSTLDRDPDGFDSKGSGYDSRMDRRSDNRRPYPLGRDRPRPMPNHYRRMDNNWRTNLPHLEAIDSGGSSQVEQSTDWNSVSNYHDTNEVRRRNDGNNWSSRLEGGRSQVEPRLGNDWRPSNSWTDPSVNSGVDYGYDDPPSQGYNRYRGGKQQFGNKRSQSWRSRNRTWVKKTVDIVKDTAS